MSSSPPRFGAESVVKSSRVTRVALDASPTPSIVERR
jgi:hypothetical protein